MSLESEMACFLLSELDFAGNDSIYSNTVIFSTIFKVPGSYDTNYPPTQSCTFSVGVIIVAWDDFSRFDS